MLRIPAIALGFTYFREWEQYLPLYRKLFPDFTLHRIDDVHYCHYEWYDGADAPYLY